MKKTLSALLIIATLLTLLISCKSTDSGKMTLVISTETPTEYELEFKGEDITEGLISVLKLLEIPYTESFGMLSSVGELAPEPPVYIYIFTSVEKDFDVSEYATTTKYNGVTLTSAGIGAKDMTITDGAIIYIGTISYE